MEDHEQKYSSELDTVLQQYHHLEGQTKDFDSEELQKARLYLRLEKENTAAKKLQKACAGQFDPAIMSEAKQDISELLNEENKKRSVLESIHSLNTERRSNKVSKQAER